MRRMLVVVALASGLGGCVSDGSPQSRAAFAQAVQDATDNMARARQQASENLRAQTAASAARRPVTCTSTTAGAGIGNVTTTCQ